MKDRMERFVVMPFSLGCSSKSSVAVANTSHQDKKPNQLLNRGEESYENGSFKKEDTMDNTGGGASISDGLFKIIRSFKSFSHFFIRSEEEEMEPDMEIGFPTDVKHLSHIGLDGTTFDLCSTTTSSSSSSSFPFTGFHLTTV